MLEIHCQEPWFSKIKAGVKKIEGRKYSAKYAFLQPGEIIKFYCDQDSFLACIVKIIQYTTLEDYLTSEGVENVLPGVMSFEEAINIYLSFNSRENLVLSGGFLAIHVKVVAEE